VSDQGQEAASLSNLFAALPAAGTKADEAEQLVVLLAHPALRIERIVSSGQASPAGFWYDQPQSEWVLLVAGEAGLRFADEDTTRHLKAGDFLHIAAHRPHRVEWTAAGQATIWLAVHHDATGVANDEQGPGGDDPRSGAQHLGKAALRPLDITRNAACATSARQALRTATWPSDNSRAEFPD